MKNKLELDLEEMEIVAVALRIRRSELLDQRYSVQNDSRLMPHMKTNRLRKIEERLEKCNKILLKIVEGT